MVLSKNFTKTHNKMHPSSSKRRRGLVGVELYKLNITVYQGVLCGHICYYSARLLVSTIHLSVQLNCPLATFTASYLTNSLHLLLFCIPSQIPLKSTPNNPINEQIFEQLLRLRMIKKREKIVKLSLFWTYCREYNLHATWYTAIWFSTVCGMRLHSNPCLLTEFTTSRRSNSASICMAK